MNAPDAPPKHELSLSINVDSVLLEPIQALITANAYLARAFRFLLAACVAMFLILVVLLVEFSIMLARHV